MYFEFAHPCDGDFIDQINGFVGCECYFMVCIGGLNYVCCEKGNAINKMKGLLFLNGMILHPVEVEEMMAIINFPDTRPIQVFHGSKLLFNKMTAAYNLKK